MGYFIGYVFFNEIGIKIFELYSVDNTSFLKDKISSDGGVFAWAMMMFMAVAAVIIPYLYSELRRENAR